jgi:hypothetical protein
MHPLDTYEYSNDDIRALSPHPDDQYIPKIRNKVVLDSFIQHNGFLYFFRFTISSEHDITDKLRERFSKLDHSRRSVLSTFVILDDVGRLICPYPRSPDLRNLTPYSS